MQIATGLQFGVTATGIVAAYLWYQSTRVEIPADASVHGYVYEGHPDLTVHGIAEMSAGLRAQSRINKHAAIWTGVSVLLQALAASLAAFGI